MKSNFRDSIDTDAHGKLNNNNSDSGVFTSESSKENEEKEEKDEKIKKQGKKLKRVIKRKPISYRVRKKPENQESLTSTDSSLDLKDNKVPELPPVSTKHLVINSEKPDFFTPRSPQKLPKINTKHSNNNIRSNNDNDKVLKSKNKKNNNKLTRELSINNELITKPEEKLKEVPPAKRFKQRPKVLNQRSRSEEVGKQRTKKRGNLDRNIDLSLSDAPKTGDTVVVEVARSKSDTTIPSIDKRNSKLKVAPRDEMAKSSSSLKSLLSSKPVLSSNIQKRKKVEETVTERVEETDPHEKHLTLLNLGQ